jgi:ubiquinone/menaquinone biosynthesis C-methylase UbiE
MASSENEQLGIMPRLEGLLAVLGSVSGKRIIDIGCGEGEIAKGLATAGATVIGYDPYIDGTELIAAGEGCYQLRHARADAIPEADESADIVLFVFSLHHVPGAMMGIALLEARRLLVPGGILCIVEPVAEGPAQYVMEPYHDETAPRAAAITAIADHLTPAFASERVVRFCEARRFADFDAYAAQAIGNMRFNGYTEDDVLDQEVRRRFEEMAALHGPAFVQPIRINLYQ